MLAGEERKDRTSVGGKTMIPLSVLESEEISPGRLSKHNKRSNTVKFGKVN